MLVAEQKARDKQDIKDGLSRYAYNATVVGVTDGEMIAVDKKDANQAVRMLGIDCPEDGQPLHTRVASKKMTLSRWRAAPSSPALDNHWTDALRPNVRSNSPSSLMTLRIEVIYIPGISRSRSIHKSVQHVQSSVWMDSSTAIDSAAFYIDEPPHDYVSPAAKEIAGEEDAKTFPFFLLT